MTVFYLVLMMVLANVPWLLDRRWFLFLPLMADSEGVSGSLYFVKGWWRSVLEWSVYFVLVMLIGLGLEYRAYGENHPQDWEFYVVNGVLFMVFAFPSVVYRTTLVKYLSKSV